MLQTLVVTLANQLFLALMSAPIATHRWSSVRYGSSILVHVDLSPVALRRCSHDLLSSKHRVSASDVFLLVV